MPTWLCVQPARVEELRGEVDVHVTEKQQDVASLPEAGSDIQSLPPGKFSIQLDKGEISEVGSSGRYREQMVRGHHSSPHYPGGQNPLENTWLELSPSECSITLRVAGPPRQGQKSQTE